MAHWMKWISNRLEFVRPELRLFGGFVFNLSFLLITLISWSNVWKVTSLWDCSQMSKNKSALFSLTEVVTKVEQPSWWMLQRAVSATGLAAEKRQNSKLSFLGQFFELPSRCWIAIATVWILKNDNYKQTINDSGLDFTQEDKSWDKVPLFQKLKQK